MKIKQIIEFLQIIDQFKSIERRTKVSRSNRYENDAEHTWHMCMFALLLHKEIDKELNLERTLRLILIHDLVEIYAGDTFVYDSLARVDKTQREDMAAHTLFAELPGELEVEFHELWKEYEGNNTKEARFAQAIDKMQAFSQNVLLNGEVWKENKITPNQIIEYNESWSQQNKTFEQIFNYLWRDAVNKNIFYTPETKERG